MLWPGWAKAGVAAGNSADQHSQHTHQDEHGEPDHCAERLHEQDEQPAADDTDRVLRIDHARLFGKLVANTVDGQDVLRLVLGREPHPAELALARAFLEQSPLSEFCRALFNLNDFVYVE